MKEKHWQFELRCIFDGTIFTWPPDGTLTGRDAYEALESVAIVCPGNPDEMIASHIEVVGKGRTLLSFEECFEVLSYREVIV